jgi:hypothetical protein
LERQYPDGSHPQLLDLIWIPLRHHQPHGCQRENYLIDEGYWQKDGEFPWSKLRELEDTIDGQLWVNGYHSYNGFNDRIPEENANALPNSLVLIRPEDIAITVGLEGLACPKRKIRAKFSFANVQYKLAVTDPYIERCFMQKEIGVYPLEAERIYMSISIGEPFGGYCYKLIASILAQPY